jgi:hypothetical protein
VRIAKRPEQGRGGEGGTRRRRQQRRTQTSGALAFCLAASARARGPGMGTFAADSDASMIPSHPIPGLILPRSLARWVSLRGPSRREYGLGENKSPYVLPCRGPWPCHPTATRAVLPRRGCVRVARGGAGRRPPVRSKPRPQSTLLYPPPPAPPSSWRGGRSMAAVATHGGRVTTPPPSRLLIASHHLDGSKASTLPSAEYRRRRGSNCWNQNTGGRRGFSFSDRSSLHATFILCMYTFSSLYMIACM